MNAPDSGRLPAADVRGFLAAVWKAEILKWLIMVELLPSDSAPQPEKRYRHLFALCLWHSGGKRSIKKSQGEHLTAATDGKPRTTLSNTNLQEAAGPVHREKSASFTRQLDSAVWLAPGCVCVCVTCIGVCGSFQLAWMYLSMCCAEDGSGRRVKNSNCG